MNWKLNETGQYISGDFIIEHLPTQNELKPYFLYAESGKQKFLNFIGNYPTLDAAKYAAWRV